MSLSEELRKAIRLLRSGVPASEAQVKQAVIIPILRCLQWDDSNLNQIYPEYSTKEGFVDYALFTPAGPRVFIEAKRIGGLGIQGETQLFTYAANKGIPILILTDGNHWNFYLSMAPGEPSERCFLSLELMNDSAAVDSEKHLRSVLRRDNVEDDSARQYAENLLESKRRNKRARQQIPLAWQSLVSESDGLLQDLLVEKVGEMIDAKPTSEDVVQFLHALEFVQKPSRKPPHETPIKNKRSAPRSKIVGFQLGEHSVQPGSAIGTLVELIKYLANQDPQFMEQLASKTVGRTRRLVARRSIDLYDNPIYVKHAKDLGNGWWLGGQLSGNQVRKKIEIALSISNTGSQFSFLYN